MNSPARVTSIEALDRFRAAMEIFDADARAALAALQLEVRRVLEWIEHDRTSYWPRELRKSFDRVTQARNDLERCLLRSADGTTRSCYDEKKALERAKRRVRTCEEKIQQVKYWRRQLRHDAEEFTAQLTKLETYLDVDWARAVAALKRMVRSLENYAEIRRPDSAPGGNASARQAASPRWDDSSGEDVLESESEGNAVPRPGGEPRGGHPGGQGKSE